MRGIERKEFDIVHKTIMEVGKRQFLEKGYEGANLRDLCKAADITTSTFYCHFGDKHTLLSALVEEAAVGFEQLLRSCLDEISKMVDECPENFYTEHYRRDIPLLLDYIYRYFDSFKLMVSCGQRNVWNGFIRRLAVIETEYAKKVSSDVWFSKTFLEEMMVFIHYSFYAGLAGLFETVIHNIPKSKAESIIKPLAVYQIKGWNRFAEEMEVMGLGVSAKQAEEDACKMEHIISEESFRALKMGLKEGIGKRMGD